MAEVHSVDVGGCRLYVEELGKDHARTIVFGHSLLCDGRMFTEQVIDLAQDHRVINIDFRGHGRSDVPRRRYSIKDQGDDYVRVMDALGVERAVIAGLSMGGMAAMHLALDHPDRVEALVLMNTSAGPEEAAKRLKYGTLLTMVRALGVRPFLARQASAIMFGETFHRQQADVVALWEERLAAMTPEALVLATRMVTSRPSVVKRLGEIKAPTLVIGGDEDRGCPPRYARQLLDKIPTAALEIMPQTGHLSTIERPQRLARAIRRFCEALPTS